MNYWLMKSEPDSFGIDHLKKSPKSSHCWDGVRNYQARNYMRDGMQIGDQAFFYHSSCKVPGIAGIVEIVSASYADHTAFDPDSEYYDPSSSPAKPRWFMRDVKFVKKFPHIIAIGELRANPRLASMIILKPGNRLSITPVTPKEWQAVLAMIG